MHVLSSSPNAYYHSSNNDQCNVNICHSSAALEFLAYMEGLMLLLHEIQADS